MPMFVHVHDQKGHSYAVADLSINAQHPVSGYPLEPNGDVKNAVLLYGTLEFAGIVFLCHGLHTWMATDSRIKAKEKVRAVFVR
jgi:hypothetical protein